MKKLLTLLLAVGTVVAFTGSASALICTNDTKPAATLLIPYFAVQLNSSDAPVPNGTDTLVTVVNASAVGTLAHVTVWNRHSLPVLDFNVGLSGYDVVSFSMAQVLTGNLPNNNPEVYNASTSPGGTTLQNLCAGLTTDTLAGYVRFFPVNYPSTNDTTASTLYNDPVFTPASFGLELAAELDGTDECGNGAPAGYAPDPNVPLQGYVTVDMVNYCTFSNPNNPKYWNLNAGGFENNLWGDYTLVNTGTGLPTYASPAVDLEASISLNGTSPGTGTVLSPPANNQGVVVRTFYARYWESPVGTTPATINPNSDTGISNDLSGSGAYLNSLYPGFATANYGDMREPLGIRYAVRYGDVPASGISSYIRAWRASSSAVAAQSGGGIDGGTLGGSDLAGPIDPNTGAFLCQAVEPNVSVVIWDEDENPQQPTGCTFSPCPPGQKYNFPYETQRVGIEDFAGALNQFGWIYINFASDANPAGIDQSNGQTVLDQAWAGYDIQAAAAFVNMGVDGVSLDGNSCVISNGTTIWSGASGTSAVSTGGSVAALLSSLNFKGAANADSNPSLIFP